jgi:hypothetical protein
MPWSTRGHPASSAVDEPLMLPKGAKLYKVFNTGAEFTNSMSHVWDAP